ncbi:MAG: DUF5655 domain-containing protein [Hyphomicrobiales bacterium]
MVLWECPACGRAFGRNRQSHVCVPAMSLDAYFAGRPPGDRPIFDAVHAHLAGLGPVYVEPVGVGILFKRVRTFVELRPRRAGLALSFILARRVDHPRITRHVPVSRGSAAMVHYVLLRSPEDVDDQVRRWLTASYADSPA